MKKAIFAAAAGCLSLMAGATDYQPIFLEGRQWSWTIQNSLSSYSGTGLCTDVADVTVGRDTVIDGITMKRLEINRSYNYDACYFGYEKDRKVYLRDNSGREYLLFDFNAKPGDEINNYLRVTGEDNIGEHRRLILNDGETCWVEGIGCPDGCVSVIESPYPFPSNSSIPHLAMSCYDFKPFFNSYFHKGEAAGKVKIHDGDDSDYKTFLVEGKEWVTGYFMPDFNEFTQTITSHRVTGDKKTVDGKECTVIAVNGVYPEKRKSEFCLYEADKKVWYPQEYGGNVEWLLLYDFNLHKGDGLDLKYDTGEEAYHATVIEEDYVVSDGGVAHRRLIFDNGMTWIEGFGMGGNAIVPYVVPDCICFETTIIGNYHRSRLWNYQCSGQGLPLAGVKEVAEPTQSDDGRRYDLLGRELGSDPTPGTIYISHGKLLKK